MPRRTAVPGLRWRGGYAYYERSHARLKEGRIYKSMGVHRNGRDSIELAVSYAHALNTLGDRGDWGVIERWRRGDVDITDIAHAVREGEYHRLKRLSVDGTMLGEAVDRFLARTEATKKPKTAHTYAMACGLLLEHFGRDLPMASLTVQQAEAWLHGGKRTTAGKPWSPRSQGNARTIYGALWGMVIEQEDEAARQTDSAPVVTRNPWRKARTPVRMSTRHVFLSADRWRALIADPAVRGHPVAALLGCACLAGLRQQEIVYLRPDVDVDLAHGRLRVQNRKGQDAWSVKYPRSQRDVPVVPELRALLEEHVRRGYAGERFFFRVWNRDEPMSAVAAQDWTRRAFTAAHIQYGRRGDSLTLHSLRHTFGTWMAQEGVPFHVIGRLMGNTAQVVIQHYAHMAPDDIGRAMKVIADRSEGR